MFNVQNCISTWKVLWSHFHSHVTIRDCLKCCYWNFVKGFTDCLVFPRKKVIQHKTQIELTKHFQVNFNNHLKFSKVVSVNKIGMNSVWIRNLDITFLWLLGSFKYFEINFITMKRLNVTVLSNKHRIILSKLQNNTTFYQIKYARSLHICCQFTDRK